MKKIVLLLLGSLNTLPANYCLILKLIYEKIGLYLFCVNYNFIVNQ